MSMPKSAGLARMECSMKKVILTVTFAFIFLISHPAFLLHCFAQEENTEVNLNLYAQSAVLMDADSGRVLYGKNEEQIMPMASTTKIMTCIVALENADMEDFVKVSSYAAGMPKVKLTMQEGEYYRLGGLLYSLMLESHNDTAVAIAEHVGGSVEGFARMMNQKARDIGCFDTYFVTPNGLDAVVEKNGKIHSTTARDLAKIMSYCIGISEKKEEFLEITRTPSYGFSNYRMQENGEISQGGRYFSCNNHNAFLTMMDGALSGKTGFTNKAGYCYVGALRKDGKTFVVALLACGWPNNKHYKWSDTKTLMNYGLENYEYREMAEELIDENRFVPIPVENGQTEKIGGQAYVTIGVLEGGGESTGLLMRKDEQIEVSYSIKESLTAPVKEGTMIGKVQYSVDGTVYRTEILVTKDSVDQIDFRWCVEKVLWNFGL